jgi:hypothetical protein
MTRITKDGCVDGYIILGGRKRNNIVNIQYFSIYGLEGKTEWKEKRKKFKQDLEAVLKDANEINSNIVKWNIVTNFDSIKK